MANTTNFGWETPDDTDLVKDGASAMRTLGNAIDTSLVDLKGGTTGQVLSKASNTDMDFTWTSETDPTAISKTLLDAKADLITATAADTPARLAVGTDGQVLTADSTTSTGLKWAAGGSSTDFTLLNTGGTALTGAATITVNITSYTNLYIFMSEASSASASSNFAIRFNGDSGSNYRDNAIIWEVGLTGYLTDVGDKTSLRIGKLGGTASGVATSCIQVFGAKSTSPKPVQILGGGSGSNSTAQTRASQAIYLGNAAITSVSVISETGNFDNGTLYIYGAN